METAGGALAPVLFAAFSLPCALLLFTLGRAALHAAADALRGDRGGGGNGNAWRPTRSAFLGYRVARPGGGASGYPGSVFRDDDEPPLPRECCDRLPLAAYRQEQGRPDPECVFCLSAVVDGDEVRELRCRHVFHRGCLDAWLVRPRATCPLCRDRLLPADDPPRACAADDADGYGYGFGFEDDGAAHGDLSSTSPPPSMSVYAHSGALWHMT